jgi:hypothetical protein
LEAGRRRSISSSDDITKFVEDQLESRIFENLINGTLNAGISVG